MGLNIKRPEAEAAIRELAQIDGVGLTDAVEVAVREAIERRRTEAERRERVDRLMAYLRTLPPAPPLPPGARSNHDELYDEDGFPA